MAAVRADDLDQLVPLFERYHGPLFNYLTRLTNDRETSEDLTQTVFERILKYRSSYQPTQPFKAWVYQMARNVHADYWQRQQKLRAADVTSEVERTGGLRGAAFSQMRVEQPPRRPARSPGPAARPATRNPGAEPLPGLRLRGNREAAGLHRRSRPRESPPRPAGAAQNLFRQLSP